MVAFSYNKEGDMSFENSASGIIQVNGAKLYYEIAGQGATIVLVHSGIADSRMWDALFQDLSKNYQVLRYDLRGFGKSPVAPQPFTHAADLHALLEKLNIPRAVFVGSSKGGTIILDYALEYPEQIQALVIACSAPSGFQFEGEAPPQWDALVSAFNMHDFDKTAELEVQIWVDGPYRTPDQINPQLRELVRDMDSIALRNEATGVLQEEAAPVPAVERLSSIEVPTLIIYGALDDPNISRAAEYMAETISTAKKIEFAKAAHFPNLEFPDQFNRCLREFISETLE